MRAAMNEPRRRRARRPRKPRGPRLGGVLIAVVVVALIAGAAFGAVRLFSATRGVAADSPGPADAAPAASQPTSEQPFVESTVEATLPPEPEVTEPVGSAAAMPEFSAERYLGKALKTVPNSKHEVALTLDDGPGEDTSKVLEILAEHDVHVTFFVVGRRANTHRQELRDMAAGGHEVANHTWTHPEPGAISESDLARQIDRNQRFIAEITGQTPRFVRPRGGKYTDTFMSNLEERGLILAHWSIHSNDVEPSPSVEQIVKNATGGAASGSVILLHETNPNTVIALPRILKELERKGLRPVTLSQLLADDSRAE